MTIMVVEGPNGAGKTTLARALAQKIDGEVIRPFAPKDNVGFHWGNGSELEERLESYEIPYNTHVEDFVIADFLGKVQISKPIILDRSAPSSLVYGSIRLGSPKEEKEFIDFWANLLPKETIYVFLDVDYETAQNRLRDSTRPGIPIYNAKEFGEIREKYLAIENMLDSERSYVLDTSGELGMYTALLDMNYLITGL